MKPTPLTPQECRAARAWLNWPLKKLADAAGASLSGISQFEGDISLPTLDYKGRLRATLEAAGAAEFLAAIRPLRKGASK